QFQPSPGLMHHGVALKGRFLLDSPADPRLLCPLQQHNGTFLIVLPLRRNFYMSGNPWLQMSPVRRNALTAVTAGLLSPLLTFLVMHLWRFDLTVPAVYWGDALY